MWIIRRLKKNGASLEDLIDIYTKQVRSLLEFAVPVWNAGLTKQQIVNIERVQKVFLHIALDNSYKEYSHALKICGLESLSVRRTNLCLLHKKH